jgi:hypothetical protein
MRRIDVGVEQADGHRRHIQCVEVDGKPSKRRLAQRHLDAAVGADALLDADAAVARDQRRRHLRSSA